VTEANGLVCSLDILFLRPEKPGSILGSAGDIDKRIKTLIDALRIPADGSEMKRHEGDDPDPNPMYCLLQDDALITTLKVETDRLLFTRGDSEHESILVIRVETFGGAHNPFQVLSLIGKSGEIPATPVKWNYNPFLVAVMLRENTWPMILRSKEVAVRA